MKSSMITAVLLLFISIIYAQSKTIEFIEYDLENGLHVILHQDNSTPIVAVSVLYHVGSKNEDPERTGFAHFFEHLMFEGSKNIPRGKYSEIVESNGGALNAFTSFDQTFYFDLLPSNQLELGLWLESERMLHLMVDSVGIETQRKVVKEEKKQNYENQPYGSLLEETFERAYSEHPYRWIPIGSVQYIDMASYDEFMDFYRTFYVPNNAVLSIAGDLSIDQTKELIEKYFGDIPRGTLEIPRPDIIEPEMTSEVRDTVFDNIQLPAVIQAYHIPEMTSKDMYAIDMLTTLLSTGQSSRIYKELVDNQQKAVAAGSFPLTLEDPGLFLSYAICNAGVDPADLEKSMQAELDKTKSELISDAEFQKLRNQMENRFVSSNSRVAGIAQSLAEYYVYYGNTNLINTELDNYMEVSKEDIKRVANEYLTEDARVVLYYLPKSSQN
ncbi:MAG: insulinase family protein [Melioribacteraceae bacterium]|nr:insulinase family protein [Melioribacteraceae bacterium]